MIKKLINTIDKTLYDLDNKSSTSVGIIVALIVILVVIVFISSLVVLSYITGYILTNILPPHIIDMAYGYIFVGSMPHHTYARTGFICLIYLIVALFCSFISLAILYNTVIAIISFIKLFVINWKRR